MPCCLSHYQGITCSVQGISALVKLLQLSKDSPAGIHLGEPVAVAITILAINNELNQDAVRWRTCPVPTSNIAGLLTSKGML